MGLSVLPVSSRVYLDANVWIYALEGHAAYAAPLKTLFARIDTGEITAITSALTLAEVLVKPFADGNTALQRLYVRPHPPFVIAADAGRARRSVLLHLD